MKCQPEGVSAAGVESADDAPKVLHVTHVWKTSHIGQSRENIAAAFEEEVAAVQGVHKQHGKKRSMADLHNDWCRSAKKICCGLGGAFEDMPADNAAAAGGA